MAEMKWNDMQEKAITTHDKSLVVSAAAGSGKTAVLVERIINKICSEDLSFRIDRLLVVTFTRAAANEMRERLGEALDKRIKKDPTNKYLLKQKMMLPLADICTMDQFFNKLVKDNFNKLSITPDYRILEDYEADIFSKEVITEIIEEQHDSNNVVFENLLDVLGCDASDEKLISCVFDFAKRSNAYPNPTEWLESIKDVYSSFDKPQENLFGKIILDDILSHLNYALKLVRKSEELVQGIEKLKKYDEVFKSDIVQLNFLIERCKNKEWDKLKADLNNLDFAKMTRVSAEVSDSYERIFSKIYRDNEKSIVVKLIDKMPATEEEFVEDAKFLNPILNLFIDIVLDYKKRFFAKKKEENAYQFNDIMHFVLDFLIDDGKLTQAAYDLREKYDEILIDEYQDTNEAQDKIFTSISQDEKNLFLVGDVKQSIYKFRLAMPKVFLDKIDKWKDDGCDCGEFISLDSNYRSRKGVLDAVNYVFENIMSKEAGEIVYDNTQSLKAGATCYEEKEEADVDILVLQKPEKNAEYEYTEVDLIAKRIKEQLKSTKVYDKRIDSTRPAELKDICILVKTNDDCKNISDGLNKLGIPSYYEASSGFFDSSEIKTIMSFLSVINNPLQDIPLLSVLMSPIFGFSADDVAKIRISMRYGRLYNAIKRSEDEKCKYFIEKYNEYRKLSSVVQIDELLRYIYEDSGYLSIVGALKDGNVRKLNLLLLIEYAQNAVRIGKSNLSSFMRYIEKMKANGSDQKSASIISQNANVVKVMTIHKSKGLEFPIVFLSRFDKDLTSKKYNSYIINDKIGMGMKVIDKSTYRKYSTVQYSAANILKAKEECSEELRVLYVAMTRAREKLIITGCVNDIDKYIVEKTPCDSLSKIIDPIAVLHTNTYLSMLLKAYFLHPNAQALRTNTGYRDEFDTKANFKLNIEFIRDLEEEIIDDLLESEEIYAPDEEALELIKEKTSYSYPYSSLSSCMTKVAASSLNNKKLEMRFFASDVPKFTKTGGLTSAEKGTAVHRFMETCDFSKAEVDIAAERDKLLEAGKITKKQADCLDLNMVSSFFKSDLYQRIKKSNNVLREQKFTIDVPVNLAFETIDNNFDERVLVQGVIDCAFFENGKIVILDYKTDAVKDLDELADRYHRQLEIYKIAAEKTFSTEVKELILYSFKLNEEKLIKI